MKFNKILIVTILLLTIFAISTVSATEHINPEDTVNSNPSENEKISTTHEENANTNTEITQIKETTNTNEISDENKETPTKTSKPKKETKNMEISQNNTKNTLTETYSDNDFYITVKENYTEDKSDWDKKDLIYIASYSNKNGTFKILVNNLEKQSIKITNGYFSVEDDGNGGTYNNYFKNIYPNDLDLIDCGTYTLQVKFEDNILINNQQVNLKEKEDFDIYLINPYYCEEEYLNSYNIITIDSNHLNTGNLEIYVNKILKLNYTLTNGCFENIEDCSNKSRYITAYDLVNTTYGTYNIQINFTENGLTKELKNETVVIAEFEPTTNPKIDAYLDLYTLNLPADNIAHIYLPHEATGTLTVTYNNIINENIPYSKGHADYYIHAWNLNHLGENIITFTYTGTDFGKLTTNITCIVQPDIKIPFYASLGEEFKISMTTHDWVNGLFNIYDHNNNVKGKLLTTGTITNGQSTVILSSNKLGLNKYYLEFNYPGGDYPLTQEIYIIENSKNITVNVPSEIELGSNLNIQITTPITPYNFAYISIDDGDYEFYSTTTGEVIKTISTLNKGYHKISVQYNDGYYSDGYLLGNVYSNTFKINVIETPKTEPTEPSPLQTIETPKNSIKKIKPKLTSKNKTFKVKTKNKKITANLKDNKNQAMKNIKLTLKIKNKTYTAKTNKKGIAIFKIKLNKKGKYKATIKFKGNSKYKTTSKTIQIKVK